MEHTKVESSDVYTIVRVDITGPFQDERKSFPAGGKALYSMAGQAVGEAIGLNSARRSATDDIHVVLHNGQPYWSPDSYNPVRLTREELYDAAH